MEPENFGGVDSARIDKHSDSKFEFWSRSTFASTYLEPNDLLV